MAARKSPRLNEAKFSYTDATDVLDAEIIYAGNMVVLNTSTLEASEATSTSGFVVLGVATETVDNTDDGEEVTMISTAIHGMDKVGTITRANIGDLAYVEDAGSVSVSGGPTSHDLAGPVVEVDDDYAYIDFDPAKKRL